MKKDIIFFLGYGLEYITPHKIDLQGMGGSELSLREMSEQFVKLGYRVRVYADCGKDHGEGIYNGVEWLQTEKYHHLTCDILVVSRQADMLNEKFNIKAKVKVLWIHDLYPKHNNQEWAYQADIIFALSGWHKQFLLDNFSYLDANKVIITGNGLNLDRFKQSINRNPHKVIVSSSPDRYLPALLKIWPKIKEEVPDAELSVCYGFFNWERSAQLMNNMQQLQLIQELKEKLKQFETLGVKNLNRINQNQLALEFLSSGVWILPSWFQETNCIGLSEAYAAGCRVVGSNNAALGERILPEFGDKIDGDWMSSEYHDKFAKAVIKAMLYTTEEQRFAAQKYANENLSWSKFAQQWNQVFTEKLQAPRSEIPQIQKYIPLIDRE